MTFKRRRRRTVDLCGLCDFSVDRCGSFRPLLRPRRGSVDGMSTERQKMLAGEMYNPLDPELVAARERARDLCQDLNATRESSECSSTSTASCSTSVVSASAA